jgi:Ca2+-binding RTX toxin-like protein
MPVLRSQNNEPKSNAFDTESQYAAIAVSAKDHVFVGTDNPDTIIGTNGNDRIFGLGQADKLYGKAGHDIIIGGGGDDSIYGGHGDDYIEGGNGNDTIYGDNGKDIIYGGMGHDYIDGGKNDDIIYGGPGNDTIKGGNGNDAIYGQEGDDLIYGGRGNDYIEGGPGKNIIYGGPGEDEIHVNGNSRVYGEGDSDYIVCLCQEVNAQAILDGGRGRDVIEYYAYGWNSFVDIRTGRQKDEVRLFIDGDYSMHFTVRGIEITDNWGNTMLISDFNSDHDDLVINGVLIF